MENEKITCWIHEDVFNYMNEVGPTPEGDFLVFVDGVGRLRFRLVGSKIEKRLRNMTKVLFLCTHNSCRSQMAEGWARHLKGGVIEAWSAGTEPREVDPIAVKVMAEAGVDISSQNSKHVLELIHIPFDIVITLCGDASDTCPIFFGETARMMHRGFDDPSKARGSGEEILQFFRRVRDEIRFFVEGMPENLDEAGL